MKTFKQHIREELDSTILAANFNKDILSQDIIELLNIKLDAGLSCRFLTPYIALERASKILASANIQLPKYNFLKQENGEVMFVVKNPNEPMKYSQNIDGTFSNNDEKPMYLYFGYYHDEDGFVCAYAELDDKDFKSNDSNLQIDEQTQQRIIDRKRKRENRRLTLPSLRNLHKKKLVPMGK